VILTSNGRVILVITRADVPKFAPQPHHRTPEETRRAIGGQSSAYFGNYTVNDADKMLVMHSRALPETGSGTDQKRTLRSCRRRDEFTSECRWCRLLEANWDVGTRETRMTRPLPVRIRCLRIGAVGLRMLPPWSRTLDTIVRPLDRWLERAPSS